MVWGWLHRCDPAWSAWWFCLGCLLFFSESWRWRVSIGCANNRIYIGWITLLISVVLHFSRSSRMSRLARWWLQFDFYILHSAHSFLDALFNCFHMRVVWDWDSHYGWFFYSQNTRYVNWSLESSHSNHVSSNIRYIRVYTHMFVDELSCFGDVFFTVWIAKQISWPGAQSCTHVECTLDAKFRPLVLLMKWDVWEASSSWLQRIIKLLIHMQKTVVSTMFE